MLEGMPDAWIDGHLNGLRPGDAVGFPADTGIAHTFLNKISSEVRLLVVGEASKTETRIRYPLHPEHAAGRSDHWDVRTSARSARMTGARGRADDQDAGSPDPLASTT